MARVLPVSPDSSVLHLSFSALASLGLEESVVVVGPTDGAGLEALAPAQVPQLVPLWVPVEQSLEGSNPVSTSAPVAPVEPIEAAWGASVAETLSPADVIDGQVAQSASDPLVNLVWVPVGVSGDPYVEGVAAEHGDELSFLDARPNVELHADGFFGAPDSGAESMPFDGAAARPGAGGGGNGGGGNGGGGGAGGVVTEYKAGSADGTEGYDILIQFKGSGWTADLQTAFKNAANYFTTVITDDIGSGGRIGKIVVDDLYVTAEVKAIDGAGGILGQAGPTSVWTANQLTAAGQMQFDVADALNYQSKGLWDDIVTHEMMHVLGFGSLWNYGNDADLAIGDQYIGTAAVSVFGSPIPVETDGGSGTAGAHWDDATLGNELMTGYINDDGNPTTTDDNYLSKYSVTSLADLGYKVAYTDYSYDGTLIT